MADAPFGLALAAGMLAAVNPCGFALLPAYLSFLILGDQERPVGRATAVARALVLTAAMTLGFAAVFGLFGLVIAPVAGSIQQHLPWFTIGLGIVLAGIGAWLLAGRAIPGLRLPSREPKSQAGKAITRSIPSMAAFGASYAIASLGCAIGPFLGIVVASFDAGSVLAGIGLFVTYALGMGLLVGVAAVAISLAQNTFVHKLRRFTSLVPRVAGGLLVVVGAYVAYYGWYEVRVFSGADVDDPIVTVVENVQGELAGWLDSLLSTISLAAQ
ncbi:cytochrome c biogenesis CcdA family protein [Flindersiella endophytica]